MGVFFLMVSDVGLIAVSLISLAGMVLLFTLNNSTWFKKENFKIQKYNVMATNRLNLKKLEKDLGLKPSKLPKEEKSTVENISSWVSLLKDLDPDQIKALATKFLGGGEEYEEEEGEDLISTILKNVDEDTIKSFIDGLAKGKQDGGTQIQSQVP